MKKVIIARYGEVHLKGGNRDVFLRALRKNVAERTNAKVTIGDGRLVISEYADEIAALDAVATTFGIVSASVARIVATTPDAILGHIATLKIDGTFRVNVNRADKRFPEQSMPFAAKCGGVILDNNPTARVELRTPEHIVDIDIRDAGAYIFDRVIIGPGGLPVGTAGRAICLLSGGIDSPVAAYLAARRGLQVDFVHFATPPYTGDAALDKVKRLQALVDKWSAPHKSRLYIVNLTEISMAAKKFCDPRYTITVMRHQMAFLTGLLCAQHDISAIITGENLAQVASQTIEGLTTTQSGLSVLTPILRPLITFDKMEIIALAKKIGTFTTSIEPHEDCCTVFVPANPTTKPTADRTAAEVAKIENLAMMQSKAIMMVEIHQTTK